MSRSYASVVAPVIAVAATIGFAYASGWGPFREDPTYGTEAGAAGDGEYVALTCTEDHPEDCDPTEENLRRARDGAADFEDPQPVLEPTPVEQPDTRKPFPPAVNGVHTLLAENWLVEEGQWTLGEPPMQYEPAPGTPEPSFRTMIQGVGLDGAYITTPGFYGYYRTVVEVHDAAPSVPSWCEDAGETSLRIQGERAAFVMGSFETFTEPIAVPSGTYRVRYCTENQDRAATQDEFDSNDEYTVYAGRHLVQLWHAPRRPDRVLREGSRWAQQLGR